ATRLGSFRLWLPISDVNARKVSRNVALCPASDNPPRTGDSQNPLSGTPCRTSTRLRLFAHMHCFRLPAAPLRNVAKSLLQMRDREGRKTCASCAYRAHAEGAESRADPPA